jgi:hypothetical protein
MPDLAPEEVLAKAHAQLALELIRKEIGWSYGSEWVGEDCLDLGDENRRAFWQAYEIYQQEYLPLQTANEQARSQAIEFDRWRKHLGLGLDGKIHRIVFKSKVTVRNLLTSGAKLAAKGKNKVGSSK